jgi:hypothetical protein
MNKKITLFAIVLVISAVLPLFFQGCTKETGKSPKAPDPVVPASPTNTTTVDPCDSVSYLKHVRPIVTKICLSCHGDVQPSSGYSLNSYDQLKAKGLSGRLAARVVRGEGGFMPQGRAMANDTIQLINCWIKNGYKP